MSLIPTIDRPGRPGQGCDTKVGRSLVTDAENRFVERHIDQIPRRVETHHLTLMTLVWSAGLIAAGALAGDSRWWLLVMAAMVVGQYLTDLFDGKVGKKRGTGLVTWGFFMDHLLDFVFAGAFVIGFSLMAPGGLGFWFMVTLLATGAMMALSFLAFAATREFRIAFFGVGPTEIRAVYVAICLAVFGIGTSAFTVLVPAIALAHVIAVVVVAHSLQRKLWYLDMDIKAADSATNSVADTDDMIAQNV